MGPRYPSSTKTVSPTRQSSSSSVSVSAAFHTLWHFILFMVFDLESVTRSVGANVSDNFKLMQHDCYIILPFNFQGDKSIIVVV